MAGITERHGLFEVSASVGLVPTHVVDESECDVSGDASGTWVVPGRQVEELVAHFEAGVDVAPDEMVHGQSPQRGREERVIVDSDAELADAVGHPPEVGIGGTRRRYEEHAELDLHAQFEHGPGVRPAGQR